MNQQDPQKMYDLVVMAGLGILTGEMTRDMVIQKLEGGRDNLAETIGHTASNVVRSVVGGVAKQNREVPKEVIGAAAQEITAELVEIAVAAKLLPKEQAPEVGKAALMEARKFFMQAQQDGPAEEEGETMPESQEPPEPPMKSAPGADQTQLAGIIQSQQRMGA